MYVPYIAGHFTAHYHSAMTMVHNIILYNYILCRHSSVSSILILTRFKTDRIISNIKSVVVDQYISAGFNIQTVTILGIPRVTHVDISNNDILTAKRVAIPSRRILNSRAVKEDPLALYYAHHSRSQIILYLLVFLYPLEIGNILI